jgi:hypothetical protein
VQNLFKAMIAMLAASAVPAMGATESSKMISHVGVQGGAIGYVIFAVPPTQGCAYNNIYFDVSTDTGKAYYALLLSAKSGNVPVSRIDFTKDAAGTCTANLVEM